MTRYRHKATGDIVLKWNNGKDDVYLTATDYSIPARYVENSNDWQEVKQPLFTTEDGKDVYEEDRVWYVGADFKLNFYDFINTGGKTDLSHWPSLYKYFSTRESAEKYIDENKPVFSKKQIRNAVCRSMINRDEIFKNLGI